MSGTNEVRVVNEATGGMKGSKDEDFSLLPFEQLAEVAKLYAFGAAKYDRSNWMLGYAWHLSFASLMRHAAAWWNGEFDDEESGCDHMTSVVFHALALMYFRRHHPDLDDRPVTEIAKRQAEREMQALIEQPGTLLCGSEATTPADEAPQASSEPRGGAVAVFRHVSGAPLDGHEVGGTYYVATGMEAPAGYRFSHIEAEMPSPSGGVSAKVTYGQQIVPHVEDGASEIANPVVKRVCPCRRGEPCEGFCVEGDL